MDKQLVTLYDDRFDNQMENADESIFWIRKGVRMTQEVNCDNPYNYLLDTTAFNRFAEHKNWLEIAKKSLTLGFHYYKTVNQDYELHGRGAKTYTANGIISHPVTEQFRQKMLSFDEIQKQLEVKRVSSIASLMPNHWILDGTYRILHTNSDRGVMTRKILDFNEKLRKKYPFAQHYDAMGAEAAIYNHCTLVTDDSDLKDMVNESFPSGAIATKELVELIEKLLDGA